MKHIKKYEKYEKEKIYWLLPTDKRYWRCIKEIGCPVEYAKDIRNCSTGGYIYVSYNDNTSYEDGYSWMPFEGYIKCNFYDENNYIFKGPVNLKKEEIDKISIMEDSNKYNI